MTGPQIFLLVFLWIDGAWVGGWDVPGYSPRLQQTFGTCIMGSEAINSLQPQPVTLEDGSVHVVQKFRGQCVVVY